MFFSVIRTYAESTWCFFGMMIFRCGVLLNRCRTSVWSYVFFSECTITFFSRNNISSMLRVTFRSHMHLAYFFVVFACVYATLYSILVTCFRGQEQLGRWHERWCAILRVHSGRSIGHRTNSQSPLDPPLLHWLQSKRMKHPLQGKTPFQRAAKAPQKKTWAGKQLQLFKRDKSGDVVGTQQEDLWTHVPRDPGVPAGKLDGVPGRSWQADLCFFPGRSDEQGWLKNPPWMKMKMVVSYWKWRFSNVMWVFRGVSTELLCHFLWCLWSFPNYCSWLLNKRDPINYDNIPSLKLTLYWTSRSSQNLYLLGWLQGAWVRSFVFILLLDIRTLWSPCDRKPKR